jgi:hypothetical protein
MYNVMVAIPLHLHMKDAVLFEIFFDAVMHITISFQTLSFKVSCAY